MPAPRIRVNNAGLQAAFTAFSDYLDGGSEGGKVAVTGGSDIIVREVNEGQFIVESLAKAYTGGFAGKCRNQYGTLTEDLDDYTKPWIKYDYNTGVFTEEESSDSEGTWDGVYFWRKEDLPPIHSLTRR